jgi:hypothetical protein
MTTPETPFTYTDDGGGILTVDYATVGYALADLVPVVVINADVAIPASKVEEVVAAIQAAAGQAQRLCAEPEGRHA